MQAVAQNGKFLGSSFVLQMGHVKTGSVAEVYISWISTIDILNCVHTWCRWVLQPNAVLTGIMLVLADCLPLAITLQPGSLAPNIWLVV